MKEGRGRRREREKKGGGGRREGEKKGGGEEGRWWKKGGGEEGRGRRREGEKKGGGGRREGVEEGRRKGWSRLPLVMPRYNISPTINAMNPISFEGVVSSSLNCIG